ncbi:response regulator transcription factor [Bacillus luteolus]|uniref:Response regulator transcription factor n=1 Tax=Litchfieldia luteola TaxID=682179 RepID=A0ABR9QHC4_9BACI|nr:response regulator transcription factor [Cytobacillus luteolus]MBE4907831.1 response regulator transcription factor [Cytobacillus luteolus]MBP1944012.1 DNA-binding NarL/FixJ family response regulator [Cytobacillus luteolus]
MIKILIADDQELIRGSLRIVLRGESDIEVVGLASNGVEAVQLCKQHKPDVVLMDIHMPEMDGIEATMNITTHFPETRVVMLTTFHDMEHVREALKAGAVGYLLKAMQPEDLASSIRLVHKGETLIPQEIAKVMIAEWTMKEPLSTNAAKKENETKPRFGLTEREMDVLRLLAYGKDNREIARELFLAEGTVKNYISTIYSKLEVQDRLHAVLKAREEKLIES